MVSLYRRLASDSLPISALPGLVQEFTQQIQELYQVRFDCQFLCDLDTRNCSNRLPAILASRLEEAARYAEEQSTIELSVHDTQRGLELELIASVASNYPSPLNAFAVKELAVGRGFFLSTYQSRCPDGTVAWIIVQSQTPRLKFTA